MIITIHSPATSWNLRPYGGWFPIHSPFQSRHDVRSPQFIHMNPRKIVPVVVQSYFCPGQSTFSILFCSSNPKAVIFIAINGVIIPGWLTSTVVFSPSRSRLRLCRVARPQRSSRRSPSRRRSALRWGSPRQPFAASELFVSNLIKNL